MTRKIKGLGLAFVAVAAMSMVVAAGAQATQIHATTQAAQAVLHGNQVTQHVFTTAAGTVKCTQATFEGTAASTEATEIVATATYTGCQAFGQQATIDMNGCKFVLTSKNASGVTIGSKTVNVDVTGCTTGKVIEVTTAICRVTVPQQHNLGHIIFSNGSEPPHDVTANINVANIQYEMHGPLCPNQVIKPTEPRTTGSYTGQATFQAYPSLGTTQATHNGHQYQRHTRGSALGLQVT